MHANNRESLFVDVASEVNAVDKQNLDLVVSEGKDDSNLPDSEPKVAFPLPFELFDIKLCEGDNSVCFKSAVELENFLTDSFGSLGIEFLEKLDSSLTELNLHAAPMPHPISMVDKLLVGVVCERA